MVDYGGILLYDIIFRCRIVAIMAIPEKNAGGSFANFLSEVSQISLGHLAIINHQIANRELTFEHFLSHVRATNRFFMSSNTFSMAACTCNGWNIL